MNRQLAQDLRSRCIPVPKNLFSGAGGVLEELPRDVLMFHHDTPFEGGTAAVHSRFVLLACLEHLGGVIVNDRVFRLPAGHGIVIFPHQAHHYTRFDPDGQPFCWLFVTFDFDNVRALEDLRDRPFRFGDESYRRLSDTIQAFRRWNGHPSKHSGQVNLHLALLLAELLHAQGKRGRRLQDAAQVGTDTAFLESVCNVVHENLAGDLHLQTIAAQVALSESYLQARFRKIVGIGLGTYVRQTRLYRACGLLHSSDQNISEIAAACGFESLFSFSRAFRRMIGQSPSAYRAGSRAR